MSRKSKRKRLAAALTAPETQERTDTPAGDGTEPQSAADPQAFRRTLTLVRADMQIDQEQLTVTFPFSSEYQVRRWFGLERLLHTPDAVDFSLMTDGRAPGVWARDLYSHEGEQVGVVERAWLADDGRGWCTVRFSKRQYARECFADVEDKIRRNVSFGYEIVERVLAKEGEDSPDEYDITKWRPYEVTFVLVAADPTVGVGRSAQGSADPEPAQTTGAGAEDPKPTEPKERTKMDEKDKTKEPETDTQTRAPAAPSAPKVDIAKIREDAVRAEQERAKEIMATGRAFSMTAEAEKAVAEGMEVVDFYAAVRAAQLANSDKAQTRNGGPLGLTDKEVKQYSFMRVMRALANPENRKLAERAAFELEASRAYAEQTGVQPQGVYVPPDVLLHGSERAFNLTTGTGSNLRGTDHRPDMFIDILRNLLVAGRVGVTTMAGLVGNVDIPKQTGTGTAYWFNAESDDVTGSNSTIGSVTLTPSTVGAQTDVYRSLLKQATPDAENLVRNDITAIIALAIDLAILKGTGASGQPTGISETASIDSQTWATANTPTFAEVVAMETAVNTANANMIGNMSYVLGAAMRGACKTTLKASNVAGYIMEGDGSINGYPSEMSNQLAAGEVMFGAFASCILGLWGGLDLQVNPYISTLESRGAIRITALQDVDVAVRQPGAFSFYQNSGGS